MSQKVDRSFLRTFDDLHPDAYCNKHEAAVVLGCSLGTIRRWTKSGEVPAERVGNRWMYRVKSLKALRDSYLTNHTNQVPDDAWIDIGGET